MIAHQHKRIATQADARSFWGSHNRMQKKVERYFVPKIFGAIKQQIRAFLTAVRERGYGYAKSNIFSIVSYEPVAKVIKELYLKSAHIEANYVLNYLTRRKGRGFELELKLQTKRNPPTLGIGFEDLAPMIDQYFRIHLLNNSALPITATTRKIIINHLINEVDRGVPLDLAIQQFTDLAITGGTPSSLSRAIMIARTSSTTALSFGGLIGAYMSGVDVDKVWVTSDDERVRVTPYSHRTLDMDEAPMMGSFYNGENIRFPGDPEASIENTVNCRCAMFFKEKSFADEVIERSLSNFLSDILPGLFVGLAIGDELLNDN